jgi:hypothetical protein
MGLEKSARVQRTPALPNINCRVHPLTEIPARSKRELSRKAQTAASMRHSAWSQGGSQESGLVPWVARSR